MSGDDLPRGGSSVELLRLRRALSEWFVLALVALLLVGTVGAWGAYTAHVDPGTRVEERTVATWSRSAEFAHSAEVKHRNDIYETGRVLRDQRAYFPRISPFLTGEYRVRYATTEGGSLDVNVDLELVVRRQSDGVVYWRSARPLAEASVSGASPGRTIPVAYRFNMSRALQSIERAETQLGDSPGSEEVVLRTETEFSGTVGGSAVDRTFVDTLRLEPDGDAFLVDDPGEITNRTTRTEDVRVDRTYSPLRSLGGPLAVIAGFGGAAVLAFARRQGELALSSPERDRLTHDRYDEWISTGTVPADVTETDERVVEVRELVDLVDVAVDTERRVLFDPERDLYLVPGDRLVYFCRPPLGDGRATPGSSRPADAAPRTPGDEDDGPSFDAADPDDRVDHAEDSE